ncbi:hypothetical protein OC842_001968 [Tilletia horrida]|uniref:Transglycosylase SLT domain-containing protein n=1 Tax=Tilletia horrida TaxID=155126 RepID=A0AAN6JSM5_9BASI|nr:hypothetical protein OC842_001968 [Tilletia horrida]
MGRSRTSLSLPFGLCFTLALALCKPVQAIPVTPSGSSRLSLSLRDLGLGLDLNALTHPVGLQKAGPAAFNDAAAGDGAGRNASALATTQKYQSHAQIGTYAASGDSSPFGDRLAADSMAASGGSGTMEEEQEEEIHDQDGSGSNAYLVHLPLGAHKTIINAATASRPVVPHFAQTKQHHHGYGSTTTDWVFTHAAVSSSAPLPTFAPGHYSASVSKQHRPPATTTLHLPKGNLTISAPQSVQPTASVSALHLSHSKGNNSAAADSTWSSKAGTAHEFAVDTLDSNKYAAFRLTSNQASYGPSEVRADLRRIMAWAGDSGNLNKAQEDETVAAILSVSARYYPELPTRAIARLIMADIKAESDFQPKLVSPGRLDSGDSWGLMQVSPGGSSQELNLFKTHARTGANSFSWVYQPSKGLTQMAQPGMPNAGPLLDWKTGEVLDMASLTNQDLFRPWINIHVASWIQSNLARTSSQDPSVWGGIARAAQRTTISAQQLLAAQSQQQQDGSGSGSGSGSGGGGSLLSINIAGIKISLPSLKSTHLSDLAKEAALLAGSSLPRSVRTGLGSWVAGPASTGEGGFAQNGDDISKQYLRAIAEGVGVIYQQDVKTSWLDGLKLNAGLVDYRP